MCGNDFKSIRVSLGLSQHEMAVKADVSFGTVSALENDKLNSPQPRIARKLATAYGVTVEQINGRPEKQPAAA